MNKDEKPFEFPQECPQRDQKFDKGVIVDVVEHEVKPRTQDQATHAHKMWEYRGKESQN